ncbi:hypothetical protein KQH60_09150 [Mycetohabitans sp. B8]|nr:hypothetical protein [Mycetohabitans sp. B8]MCG1042700.1 hypothetical protein [Mycetohabitans sp. B8]
MPLTRPLPPLREVSKAIANTSHGIDALCELLGKTDTEAPARALPSS